MREGVTVYSTSQHKLDKKQFHLHLLFSTPCLKNVHMNQDIKQAVQILHCQVYQISILHNCYIWHFVISSGMLSIPNVFLKKIAILGSLYEYMTHYYPHNHHSWLENGTTADSFNSKTWVQNKSDFYFVYHFKYVYCSNNRNRMNIFK